MAFVTGFGIGLSLIVAIGAQNAFVLRAGVRREHVFAVALVCAVSDAVLICAGVVGVGFALQNVPWLIDLVRYLGVAFLVTYAVMALRRAWIGGDAALTAAPSPAPGEIGAAAVSHARTMTRTTPALTTTIAATAAITWLNPHVYLDTVIFLGSVAQAQGTARWIFAAGCIAASFVWFFALAYGARHLGRWLGTARAWRVLDVIIAAVMLVIAATLAFGH